MPSHTHLLTLVSHKSQSHADMVPFVSALLLTCRALQNRSGIEQRRRRNFYAWSPTLCSSSWLQPDSHSASSSSPNTNRPPLLSYMLFAMIAFSPSIVLFVHSYMPWQSLSLYSALSFSAMTEVSLSCLLRPPPRLLLKD